MSEDGEMWAEIKQERRTKRWQNLEQSLELLTKEGLEYETLNASCAHYRVYGISFWPTTGKWYDPRNGRKGRGVFELIKEVHQRFL